MTNSVDPEDAEEANWSGSTLYKDRAYPGSVGPRLESHVMINCEDANMSVWFQLLTSHEPDRCLQHLYQFFSAGISTLICISMKP